MEALEFIDLFIYVLSTYQVKKSNRSSLNSFGDHLVELELQRPIKGIITPHSNCKVNFPTTTTTLKLIWSRQSDSPAAAACLRLFPPLAPLISHHHRVFLELLSGNQLTL